MGEMKTTDKLKLDAEWTDDCQGKKDYDGNVLSISTRYWPKGGGFSVFDREHPELGFRPNITDSQPSARSSLRIRFREGEERKSVELIAADFEAETFEEVKMQVEAWAQQQTDRAVAALRKEFPEAATPAGSESDS